MKRNRTTILLAVALATVAAACARLDSNSRAVQPPVPSVLTNALESVKHRHVLDSHLGIFRVGVENRFGQLALTGFVDSAAAKADAMNAVRSAGFEIADHIEVLPDPQLGDRTWGLICLSVANGREQPQNTAEMGTQELMGYPVRVWKRSKIWYLVQTADRYVCWMEKGSFELCTAADVEAWNKSELLLVRTFETSVLEAPQPDAQPVADVVLGVLLKKTGEEGDWFKVELPDHRAGFLRKFAGEDYAAWKASRRATPVNIERTARGFLGRPYLWGANSSRGLDCSGFNKFVFFLNGINLDRNASQQANQGVEVRLDPSLSQLRKGDLVFFGFHAQRGRPERITHTGIYLGDKLFIHSSERVRINSLDPASPLRDEQRIRMLLHARRILPES